jgi:hypothetical protein
MSLATSYREPGPFKDMKAPHYISANSYYSLGAGLHSNMQEDWLLSKVVAQMTILHMHDLQRLSQMWAA